MNSENLLVDIFGREEKKKKEKRNKKIFINDIEENQSMRET